MSTPLDEIVQPLNVYCECLRTTGARRATIAAHGHLCSSFNYACGDLRLAAFHLSSCLGLRNYNYTNAVVLTG